MRSDSNSRYDTLSVEFDIEDMARMMVLQLPDELGGDGALVRRCIEIPNPNGFVVACTNKTTRARIVRQGSNETIMS